jgi:SAM-dependent methyltransferase
VSGIDYSPTGAKTARWLCDGLNIAADIRCEEATANTFAQGTFDLVFSNGLIEHFEDPRPMVSAHLALLAPGGIALIAVPSYRGIYLAIQRHLDPENVAIHNLELMEERAIQALVPAGAEFTKRAYAYGSFSPWLLSLGRKWGRLGTAMSWALNMMALAQPLQIARLSPLLVLEVKRQPASRRDQ